MTESIACQHVQAKIEILLQLGSEAIAVTLVGIGEIYDRVGTVGTSIVDCT